MRTPLNLTAFLFVLAWGPGLLAQTPPAEAPPDPKNCRITLPYTADQLSDCTPQSAAAYDFAFCSVSYIITSLTAQAAGGTPAEISRGEAFKRMGMAYAEVSALLSDAATLQKNVALVKKYYESLAGKDHLIGLAADYVKQKCDSVEASHAQVLEELIQSLKRKPQADR